MQKFLLLDEKYVYIYWPLDCFGVLVMVVFGNDFHVVFGHVFVGPIVREGAQWCSGWSSHVQPLRPPVRISG